MNTPTKKRAARREEKGVVFRHRVGNWFCSITARRKGKYAYMLFTSDADGKRRERWFTTKSAAVAEADKLISKVGNHGAGEGEVSRDERSALLAWRNWVKGRPEVESLASFLSDATKRYDADVAKEKHSVEDAVAERLADAKLQGGSDRHLNDLRTRLQRFKTQFSGRELSEITAPELKEWFFSIASTPSSVRNWKKVVGSVFKLAQDRSRILANPTRQIKPGKDRFNHAVVTARQIDLLLHNCPVEARPVFIAQVFCGVRTAEALRLTWDCVRFADTPPNLILKPEVTKTGNQRQINLLPAAIAWFETCDKKAPFAVTEALYRRARNHAAALAGIEWEENILRHSFGSFRMGQIHDAGRVAGEMGNSAQVVRKHYTNLPTAAETIAFWESTPERAAAVAADSGSDA